MIPAPQSRTVWLSYYGCLDHDLDVFITEHLAPMVLEESRASHLKRFFFIRYTEETLQLRIRILPTCSAWITQIHTQLVRAIEEFNGRFEAKRRMLLKQVPYDRSLYFGETMRSVYSELLNERTSRFAFRLLHLYSGQRAKLFVVLTFVLHHILSKISIPSERHTALAEESREFAMKTIADLNLPPFVFDPARANTISGSLLSVSSGAARALQGDSDICTVIRLLQRVQRLHDGAFVRIHSLHLLANKLGFSLADEYLIFTLLKEMTADALATKEVKHGQLEQLSCVLHEH